MLVGFDPSSFFKLLGKNVLVVNKRCDVDIYSLLPELTFAFLSLLGRTVLVNNIGSDPSTQEVSEGVHAHSTFEIPSLQIHSHLNAIVCQNCQSRDLFVESGAQMEGAPLCKPYLVVWIGLDGFQHVLVGTWETVACKPWIQKRREGS